MKAARRPVSENFTGISDKDPDCHDIEMSDGRISATCQQDPKNWNFDEVAPLDYGNMQNDGRPPITNREPELSPEFGDGGSVEWEGMRYTVSHDPRYGTYKRLANDGPDTIQPEATNPFAIFGGYEQYQLINLLATSGISKAKISEFLGLDILVCVRLCDCHS